ncbi:hypothetical protein VKT23_012662 [Stygiomarasmius scandens]|uniref:WAPL domain-containing protein n=1 Tax=Marasmiellus scandens TaxID=2682957 RepID=A0ABR1J8E8_9AGAR
MNFHNLQMVLKRENDDEDTILHVNKRPRREAADEAQEQMTATLGPGGYLNNATSDTQYFGFSQSSGLPTKVEDETQVQYGFQDNDLYDEQSQVVNECYEEYEPQSQVVSEYDLLDDYCEESKVMPKDDLPETIVKSPEQPRHNPPSNTPPASIPPPAASRLDLDSMKAEDTESQAALSSASDERLLGLGTSNEEKLDAALRIKYAGENLVYRLLEKRENREGMKDCWALLRDGVGDDAARGALCFLVHKAGMPSDGLRKANPLCQGFIVVASYMIRIANELIKYGGQSKDIRVMRSMIADGRALMDLTEELLDIEEETRCWIEKI